MAKRSSTTTTKPGKSRPAARHDTAASVGAIEQQVLAFAEQLGYAAGTIRTKAGGALDRKALARQIAGVRDGAKRMLDQLATGVASRVRRQPAPKRPVRKARSGGTVDAPGKRHRKPAPAGPPAAAARARNTRVLSATPAPKMMAHRPRQG
jgi:hypothetical protein